MFGSGGWLCEERGGGAVQDSPSRAPSGCGCSQHLTLSGGAFFGPSAAQPGSFARLIPEQRFSGSVGWRSVGAEPPLTPQEPVVPAGSLFFPPGFCHSFFPLLLVILEGMKIIQLLDLLYSVLQRCQKSLGQEERRGEASRNECAPRTAAFAHKRPGSQSSAWPEPAVLLGSPALPCNAPF